MKSYPSSRPIVVLEIYIKMIIIFAMQPLSFFETQKAALERFAQEFVPVQSAGKQINRYREAIIVLRSKGASYADVWQMLLHQAKVEVSYSTVIRYCKTLPHVPAPRP
jgi:hypothetical protein